MNTRNIYPESFREVIEKEMERQVAADGWIAQYNRGLLTVKELVWYLSELL